MKILQTFLKLLGVKKNNKDTNQRAREIIYHDRVNNQTRSSSESANSEDWSSARGS